MTNSMTVYKTVMDMQDLLTVLNSNNIDRDYWPDSLKKVESLLRNAEYNLAQTVAQQALHKALKENHD